MSAFVDPAALLLILGGACALAWVQSGTAALRHALVAARPSLSADGAGEAEAARRLIHAAAAAVQHRGLFAAETLHPQHHFLRASLAELADARDADAFAQHIATLEEAANAPSVAAVAVWHRIADAAPALGMIGTVAGMIRAAAGGGMVAAPALALALTSTLYGLILAACIAGPLAERIARQAEDAARWRARFAAALVQLVRRETATAPASPRRAA